jgi:hypothetical protein
VEGLEDIFVGTCIVSLAGLCCFAIFSTPEMGVRVVDGVVGGMSPEEDQNLG